MSNSTKKLCTNIEIPILGAGTWKIGGRKERDFENDDQRDVESLIKAVSLGVKHIDTAESYADGHAETLVGEAIKGFARESIFITSKVSRRSLRYNDVITSCKQTLERLRTEYVDLYLIHWPNPEIPLRETMRAMDDIKNQGLISNIGLSNFNREQYLEAQSYTNNKIVALELHYSLVCREPENRGLLKFCQENNVVLIAWKPLQSGILTSVGSNLLERICLKYNKTPAQVALNWLISQENVIAITKMTNENHIHENLGALGWKMDNDDIELLRSDFPNQESVSNFRPLL